jgi:hypothetical protein
MTMKTYIAKDQSVTLGSGSRLELTAAQLATRGHLVTVLEKASPESGRTPVVADQPLQFKAGETVTFDGEPPKGMAAAFPDITTLKPAEINTIKARARSPRPTPPAKAPVKPKGKGR